MLYYFGVLLAASIVLAASNPKSEINRWAALFLGFASVGGLTDKLKETGNERWAYALELLNLCVTPYAVLIFGIVYSGLVPSMKWKALLKVGLLLPVVITLIVTPYSPKLVIDYTLLLVWAAPYFIGACCLLIASLLKEMDRSRRRNRLVTTLIIVPTLIGVLIFIYISKAIIPEFSFFQYISYFVAYSFGVALLCLFIYGVLGVKLRIERTPLDNTMKAVSTGTNLLNHTIKNEIGKIAISSENLKRGLTEQDEMARQQLQIISDSSEHMLAMVERMHSRTKAIVLSPRLCQLDELVEQCLTGYAERLKVAGVTVIKDFQARPKLMCDPVHLKEAIGNLLVNAIEAMPEGGEIRIGIAKNKKGIALAIVDTGKGIASEVLSHIFDPFFSTKTSKNNYGLGLSYVYNVMRKSGGSVDLTSKIDKGTCVTLYFPRVKQV